MSLIILNVDEVRRTLSVSGASAFVVNDKNVDIVRFALLTGFTDIALYEHSALRVMYQRPGETQVRAQTLVYYDTDGIHNFYDWQLLNSDLAKKGTITCALCILRTDSTVEEWHTTPYQIRVLGSIHTDDSDEADESITPTVAQRVAVLENVVNGIAGGAPIVVASTSAMTDTEQIYVLSTNGNWYYHNGSAWVAGGEYGAVATDATLTQSGIPADAKTVGDRLAIVDDIDASVNGIYSKNYTDGKNFYVYGVIHEIIDDPDASISDYVPVTVGAGEQISFFYTDDLNDSKKYYLWFFDENKEFIKSFVRSNGAFIRKNLTVPEGAAFVKISFKKGYEGSIKSNDYATLYYKASKTLVSRGLLQNVGLLEELNTIDKESLVDAINEVQVSIPSFPIKPKDTTFFYISKNMLNPADFVNGEYVNQTNGEFSSNSVHIRTDFVKVKGDTTYVLRRDYGSDDFRYAFYTARKVYISGGMLPVENDMLITSPTNAEYIAVSVNGVITNAPTWMLAEYDGSDKNFEAYSDGYILPQFLPKENLSDLLINIPSKIYALVGYETNIYFENITEEWEKYKWDVTCSKGKQLERGYRITPVDGDVGTYTLTIKASVSDTVSKQLTTTLVVTSASAGASATKSVVVLGDSTTNSGTVITKLNENFSTDVMGISTLGTRGTAPNNHEGRSGWRLETYFTVESIDYTDGRGHVENPFYNPATQTFDANYYFTNSGIAKPDWFIINMGINDMFSYEVGTALDSAIKTCIGYVDSIIASVKDASPSSKIGVCLTIPPNHSQDAFGKAYSNGQTRNRYKKNNTIWVNRLISEYDSRESEGIYLIPIHTNLDTVYNMGMETLPVNARNTDVTYQSPILNGGVHPVTSGYWQIADVYTAFLKSNA